MVCSKVFGGVIAVLFDEFLWATLWCVSWFLVAWGCFVLSCLYIVFGLCLNCFIDFWLVRVFLLQKRTTTHRPQQSAESRLHGRPPAGASRCLGAQMAKRQWGWTLISSSYGFFRLFCVLFTVGVCLWCWVFFESPSFVHGFIRFLWYWTCLHVWCCVLRCVFTRSMKFHEVSQMYIIHIQGVCVCM